MADYHLQACLNENPLRFEAKPTYLGVTLDQNLMFKVHLTKLKNKVSSSVTSIRRLAGTKWGASFGVLRTSVLALAYSPAEYCSPAWTQSAHAHKIDVPLNESSRLVLGCLHSTLVSQLPFLSGIPPPQECRDQSCIITHVRARRIDHLLHEILHVKDASSQLPFVENIKLRENCPLLVLNNLHGTSPNRQLNHQGAPFQGMHGCNSTN